MSRPEFVDQVLALYLTADETPGRFSRSDRQLAGVWYDQAVTMDEIEIAFILTIARRRFRDPALPPLAPIRSLYYFVPVLAEVRANSIPVEYVSYLRHKLTPAGTGI